MIQEKSLKIDFDGKYRMIISCLSKDIHRRIFNRIFDGMELERIEFCLVYLLDLANNKCVSGFSEQMRDILNCIANSMVF